MARTIERDVQMHYRQRGKPQRADSLLQRTRQTRDSTVRMQGLPKQPSGPALEKITRAPRQLVGTVIDAATRRPIVGAVVVTSDAGASRADTTDSAGSFVIDVPPSISSAEVQVSARGYSALRLKVTSGTAAEISLRKATLIPKAILKP